MLQKVAVLLILLLTASMFYLERKVIELKIENKKLLHQIDSLKQCGTVNF